MALTLIEMLEAPFAPQDYRDEYRDALMQLIEAKLEGQELVEAEAPETAKVVDLMAALRASVEAAGKRAAARPEAAPASSAGERSRAKAS